MKLFISPRIREKLANKQPPVTEEEITQCFANRTRTQLTDTREEHATTPHTRWFVAPTDYGRMLKVMYVPINNDIQIKSAYSATTQIIRIYNTYSKPL